MVPFRFQHLEPQMHYSAKSFLFRMDKLMSHLYFYYVCPVCGTASPNREIEVRCGSVPVGELPQSITGQMINGGEWIPAGYSGVDPPLPPPHEPSPDRQGSSRR